jgi:hypothetical protein
LLSLRCDVHDHGGSPPPRRMGARRHPPPSVILSTGGKQRVDHPSLRPANQATVAGSRLQRRDPAPVARSPRVPFAAHQPRRLPLAAPQPDGAGRWPHPLQHFLTFGRHAQGHGGTPPPRRKGARGHPPPSVILSRGGKQRVNHPSLRPANQATVADSRLQRRDPAPVARSPRVPFAAHQPCRLPLAAPQPDGAGRWPHPLQHSLTFWWQAQGHAGNPPPRRMGVRGHPPPSVILSIEGKEKVNNPGGPDCRRRQMPIYYLLTLGCNVHDHGGSPPPRRKGAQGHPPPPAGLPRGNKGKVSGSDSRPAERVDRSPPTSPRVERVAGGNRGPGGQAAAAARRLKEFVPAGWER